MVSEDAFNAFTLLPTADFGHVTNAAVPSITAGVQLPPGGRLHHYHALLLRYRVGLVSAGDSATPLQVKHY